MADEDARFKRFEPTVVADEEESGEDPVTFEIGDETFTCIPSAKLPAGAIRRLSQESWTVENTCSFIEGVLADKDDPEDLTPTQIERFRETISRKDIVVDVNLLSDITVWLIGAITARPTKSPAGSTGGRGSTSNGSKAKRSGKVSRLTPKN